MDLASLGGGFTRHRNKELEKNVIRSQESEQAYRTLQKVWRWYIRAGSSHGIVLNVRSTILDMHNKRISGNGHWMNCTPSRPDNISVV